MTEKKQIEEMAKCCAYYHNGKCRNTHPFVEECDLMCDMFGTFANLENAGYRKQSEGYWIENEDDFGVMCSECGTEFLDDQIGIVTTYKYCPNCGAKMKVGE